MPSNPFTKHEADPSFSKEERILNEALFSAIAGAAPEPPSQVLFPARIGYVRQVPGIMDVLGTTRHAADKRMDYSGVDTRYAATTRPSIGQV